MEVNLIPFDFQTWHQTAPSKPILLTNQRLGVLQSQYLHDEHNVVISNQLAQSQWVLVLAHLNQILKAFQNLSAKISDDQDANRLLYNQTTQTVNQTLTTIKHLVKLSEQAYFRIIASFNVISKLQMTPTDLLGLPHLDANWQKVYHKSIFKWLKTNELVNYQSNSVFNHSGYHRWLTIFKNMQTIKNEFGVQATKEYFQLSSDTVIALQDLINAVDNGLLHPEVGAMMYNQLNGNQNRFTCDYNEHCYRFGDDVITYPQLKDTVTHALLQQMP